MIFEDLEDVIFSLKHTKGVKTNVLDNWSLK